MFSSPVAHLRTAPHQSTSLHSRSRTRSPSPEPQWSEPAGLQASALNGKWDGRGPPYGGAAATRLEQVTPQQQRQRHLDTSVMNLSNAAVRQLSRAPEDASPQAKSRTHQDTSVIGLSRSAVREASAPPQAPLPMSTSMYQARRHAWSPSQHAHRHPVSALREEVNIVPRQNNKTISKPASQGLQSASRPRADRKPLSALSRSDMNGIHALRLV